MDEKLNLSDFFRDLEDAMTSFARGVSESCIRMINPDPFDRPYSEYLDFEDAIPKHLSGVSREFLIDTYWNLGTSYAYFALHQIQTLQEVMDHFSDFAKNIAKMFDDFFDEGTYEDDKTTNSLSPMRESGFLFKVFSPSTFFYSSGCRSPTARRPDVEYPSIQPPPYQRSVPIYQYGDFFYWVEYTGKVKFIRR